MTSELCDGGADEQREKEASAASKSSSVSPLSVAASLELPGPWSSPVSPVTMSTESRTVNQGSPTHCLRALGRPQEPCELATGLL